MHFLALGMLFPGLDQTYVVIATLLFTLHLLGGLNFHILPLFRTTENMSCEEHAKDKKKLKILN